MGKGRRSAETTILVVDDEPPVLVFAARALREAGYRVLEAPGGPEALALVQSLAHPLDLLVTDVRMPGLNGKELADRLLARHPGLPVLFISGYAGDVLRDYGLVETTDLLTKPFSSEDLVRKAEHALAAPVRPDPQ